MSDIKIIIGAEIKELEQKLAVAKSKLIDFGRTGPTALAPLQQRLSGLTFPTKGITDFGNKFSSIGGALKAFGVIAAATTAVIGIANGAVTKWFEIIKKDFVSVGNAAAETAKKIKDYADIVDSAVKSTAKESTEIIGLLSVLNSETETRERKLATIKELQKIQPEIFKGLKLEGEAVIGLDEAYQAYLINLRSVIAAKIIQAQIEAKVTELLKIQGAANTKEDQAAVDRLKNLINTSEALSAVKKGLEDTKLAGGFLTDKQSETRVATLSDEIQGLFEKLTEFSKTIKVKEIKVKPEKVKIEKPDNDLLPALPPGFFGAADPKNAKLTIKPELTIVPNVKEVIITPEAQQKVLDGLKKMFDAEMLAQFQAETSALISQTIANIATDSISTASEAIGAALAGDKNALPDLFGNLIKGLGNQISNLGKALVEAGVKMLIAKKALEALNLTPQTAIIAGVALQILGAALKASFAKNNPGFATGVRNFEGGFATVGERGPERIFLPTGSSVQPNNEMTAYGGGREIFIPAVTLSGSDLVISFNRASQQMGRNN